MDLELLLLIQILLLLASGPRVFGEKHPKNVIPPRCKFMAEGTLVYQRKCKGTYPMVAFTKYRDTLIKVGEPFSMYMPITLESVLVLQKSSPLHDCHNLQFKNTNTFHCLDTNRNETISVDEANMFCFPFHIQLPDDLMNECLIENQMNHHQHYLDQVVSTKRGIVHYTYGKGGGQSLRIPRLLPSLLPWLLPSLLPLLLGPMGSRKF